MKMQYENAAKASAILFSKSFKQDIETIDEATFFELIAGVPLATIDRADLESGLDMIAALSAKTQFLKSNSEARRALKENAISVNKQKVGESYVLSSADLIKKSYIILNKGKRFTYILKVV